MNIDLTDEQSDLLLRILSEVERCLMYDPESKIYDTGQNATVTCNIREHDDLISLLNKVREEKRNISYEYIVTPFAELDAAWMRLIGEIRWAGDLIPTAQLRDSLQALTRARKDAGLPPLSQVAVM